VHDVGGTHVQLLINLFYVSVLEERVERYFGSCETSHEAPLGFR
jgi:hypothetical protein